MESIMDRMQRLVANCSCGEHNPVTLDVIAVDSGAIEGMAGYIRERGCRQVVVVADNDTYQAAGRKVIALLEEAGFNARLVLAQPIESGDVIADEQTIVQVMLEIHPQETDLLIVVGAGTLHDIARFVGYKMGIPFISVPTAPSVDGFTSKGAPLIIKGQKITIPASSPVAIFADLDILSAAPRPMIAAGFGDMLGKFTSLFDWQFAHLTSGEAYCSAAFAMTETALRTCVNEVDKIGRLDREGIRVLMNGLIESGLAMLIFGQSYPASGAEHHLSHYWEMEYLQLGRRQLLHGAKVGVACAVISEFYHDLGNGDGEGLGESEVQRTNIRSHWTEILKMIAQIPSPDQLRSWLATAGGPTAPEEIGISRDLLDRSLKQAHHVRSNRNTLLKAFNEGVAGR